MCGIYASSQSLFVFPALVVENHDDDDGDDDDGDDDDDDDDDDDYRGRKRAEAVGDKQVLQSLPESQRITMPPSHESSGSLLDRWGIYIHGFSCFSDPCTSIAYV